MELIAVKQARSIWLIYLADLNPRGFNLFALVPLIIAKYKFLLFPNPNKIEEFDLQKGIKFENGGFQKDIQTNIEVNLTVYNDGFIADTRSSTKDSDAFLADFLTYMAEEFNLGQYKEVIRTKSYVSELFVRTEKTLNALNQKLERFGKRLTSLIEGHKHHPIAYETTGITFWTNPTITFPPGPFRFERLIDVPYAENRYYSAAPLQTEVHLELLEELEAILGS